jgi:predicted  nucleic acid-binding Zn-ribbon protein
MDNVEKKLKALIKVQTIDSKLDEIKKTRGDLPEEVQDLEDEVTGYETRLALFRESSQGLEQNILDRKAGIKESEALIIKYKDQQMNVRNNREYDAISKEMELQELEIKVSEKKIKEAGYQIELKNKDIDELEAILNDRRADLDKKNEELKVIMAESEEEEVKLNETRVKAEKALEDRLKVAYNKLRANMRNGLAVVSVRRDACGGCFATVPPQRQADIREKKKIIVCEHCGRILVDVIAPPVEEPKPKKTRKKKVA